MSAKVATVGQINGSELLTLGAIPQIIGGDGRAILPISGAGHAFGKRCVGRIYPGIEIRRRRILTGLEERLPAKPGRQLLAGRKNQVVAVFGEALEQILRCRDIRV